MRSINFRGKNIVYKDEGTGIALLLIHGFCEDSALWNEFVKFLPPGFRLICPDLPGFGKSGLPDTEISIDTYAQAVYEIVKHEKITNCILAGHSMGGYTALAFAEKHPNLLNGMILFHSSALPDEDTKKQDRLRAMEFVDKNGVAPYISELYPKLFAPGFYAANKELIIKLQEHAYNFSPDGIKAALGAMRLRPDRTEVLRNCKVPVLFIVGKKDTAIAYEKSRVQFALPDISRILLLEEVAHMGMFESPEQCANAIAEFRILLHK